MSGFKRSSGVGGRNYVDLRDFGVTTAGGDASVAMAAALAAVTSTGGVVFVPAATAAFTVNTAQTIPQNVWIWGTGWNEGGGAAGSTIAAGAAMTTLFTMSTGSGLAFLNVTDPAPLCTVTVVDTTNAASVKLIEAAVRGGALVNLPVVTLGSPGGRSRIVGGRIVNNDSANAGSIALLQSGTASDNFIGGGLTLLAPLPFKMTAGSNIQMNFAHLTGVAASTSNLTQSRGQLTCTNVQLDSCIGGPSLNLIPDAGQVAILSFVGGRILNNNSQTTNPLCLIDCTAASSIGSLNIESTTGFCDLANPALSIVQCKGTNMTCTLIGGTWLGVSSVWDVAFTAPSCAMGTVLLTGSPNPTTVAVGTDIVGRRQGRITSTSSKNSTTFSNVNGAGFQIEASAIYRFEFVIFVDGPTAGDVKFQLNGPAAPTLITYGIMAGDATTTTSYTNPTLQAFTSGGTAAGLPMGLLGAGTIQVAIIKGLCVNGANAGTIQLQAAQVAASGTTVIDLGTNFVADRMSA